MSLRSVTWDVIEAILGGAAEWVVPRPAYALAQMQAARDGKPENALAGQLCGRPIYGLLLVLTDDEIERLMKSQKMDVDRQSG